MRKAHPRKRRDPLLCLMAASTCPVAKSERKPIPIERPERVAIEFNALRANSSHDGAEDPSNTCKPPQT